MNNVYELLDPWLMLILTAPIILMLILALESRDE
jgi:hypothetical protein